MALPKFQDIELTVDGQIAVIRLNRPESLNSFSPLMLVELKAALRFLATQETVFTVLTGTGRFFSSGLDVKRGIPTAPEGATDAEKKVFYAAYVADAIDLMRDMIDHPKVIVLAYNGPAVGGGAAWFAGVADIVLASDSCYLQVPFNALALAPENGSGVIFQESMGYRRAAEFLLFGRKLTAPELESFGLANRIFPTANFHTSVLSYLRSQLESNDPGSLLLTKKLMTDPLKRKRMEAVTESMNVIAERLRAGAPQRRFEKRRAEMLGKPSAKI